jgi:hypothetical protein
MIDKETLFQLLLEHLEVRVSVDRIEKWPNGCGGGGLKVTVSVLFDGKEVCKDSETE